MRHGGTTLHRGNIVTIETAGAGGYGDPAQRPTEAVRADLREGRTSPAFAAEHYPAQLREP